MVVIAKVVQPVDREVGLRVRIRRKTIGMSQSVLAQSIGVTFQQVQKYEKGTNRIGSSRLQQIANSLGVTVSSLFGDTLPPDMVPTGASKLPEFEISKELIELNTSYMKISDPARRRAVLELVEGLASEEAA